MYINIIAHFIVRLLFVVNLFIVMPLNDSILRLLHFAQACGASVASLTMGIDPHSGQSNVKLLSLSILTGKIVLVVQNC
jgi:hypothetical protein